MKFLILIILATLSGHDVRNTSMVNRESSALLVSCYVQMASGLGARRFLTNIFLHYYPLLPFLPPPLSLPPSLHLSLPPLFSTFSLARLQLLIFTQHIWQAIPTPLPPHPAAPLLAFLLCCQIVSFLHPKSKSTHPEHARPTAK